MANRGYGTWKVPATLQSEYPWASALPLTVSAKLNRKLCMHRIILHLLILLALSGRFCSAADPADPPLQFRLPDDRPLLDREKLTALGFSIVESKRLILVTDLPAESVSDLPPLADALFDELQTQLGPLAPDLNGKEFQVTGYLMNARERFTDAKLLPPEHFQIRHGRNLGYQFWLNDQTADYYRRHLLLHEFTHCFMMCEHGMTNIPPLWYTEGISEYFATHELTQNIDNSRFGILPPATEGFEGWGRIAEIKKGFPVELADSPEISGVTSLKTVLNPPDDSFVDDQQYALAWALVWLIRNHPDLKAEFSEFDHVRSREQFVEADRAIPAAVWSRLNVIWPLFLDSVIEGEDLADSLPRMMPGPAHWNVGVNKPALLQIDAAQDWQSSGFIFTRGQTIKLSCSGRYAVHDTPRPWISEPQGITIDYYRGRPLGEVVAMIVSPDGQFVSRRITVGTGCSITLTHDGELWLQINDSATERTGNSGAVEVAIVGG